MAKKSKNPAFIFRVTRSVSAILILSALVLGISYVIKYVSKITPDALTTTVNELTVRESSESTVSADNTITLPEGASFAVAIMSDSHEDTAMLTKALTKAKAAGVKAVFYLGDYTNFGVEDALKLAKSTMDESGLTYYSLPGDHDLYKTVGPENYIKVFGKPNAPVVINGTKFVLLDNSANYTKISEIDMKWFRKEAETADFILLAQPVYANFLNRKMGVTNGEVDSDVLSQGYDILKLARANKVKAILAGDLHMSGSFKDPEKAELEHYYIGAVAKSDSTQGIINLQVPKFSILTIMQDGSYTVEDVLL